jgi:hypothetical protein
LEQYVEDNSYITIKQKAEQGLKLILEKIDWGLYDLVFKKVGENSLFSIVIRDVLALIRHNFDLDLKPLSTNW